MSKLIDKWIDLTFANPNSLKASVIPYDGSNSILAQLDSHGSRHESGGGDTVDHNSLVNTHNLTTDIDHDTITNTHNLTTDVDHDTITNTHNLTTDVDHGSIAGLGDDDHTQYSLVAGTRAFTGVVGGITPTSEAHLATKGYVDGVVQGIGDWQESVKDRYDPTSGLPAEVTGDRYLSTATANGWTANNIYEWNGSSWFETVASEGMAVWVEDEDILYAYNGSAWVKFGSTIDHGTLSGLGDDDHTIYLLAAGTRALSGDWDIGLSRKISAEKIQARSSLGLKLYEDGGKGIDVADSTGYVGIGTTNPATDLSIRKTVIGGDVHLRIRNDDNTNANSNAILSIASGGESAGDPYILFDAGTSNTWTIGEDGSDTDKFKISYALGAKPGTGDRFVIDTAGNVGIGITNPAALLSLYRDIDGFDADGHMKLENGGSASVGDYAGMLLSTHTGSDKNWFGIVKTSDSYGVSDFVFLANNNLDNNPVTDAFEVLRIKSNGRVGIGTSAPGSILEVSDSVTSILTAKLQNSHADSYGVVIAGGGSDASHYGLVVQNYNQTAEFMRVTGDGNVGIGTTNPYAPLHVQGASSKAIMMTEGNRMSWVDNSGNASASIYGTSLDDIRFEVSSSFTEAMRIIASGNVGIGAAGPVVRLEVADAVTDDSVKEMLRLGANTADRAYMSFRTGRDVGTPYRVGEIQVTDHDGATPRNLNLQPDGGLVGIGTTNPTAPLDINYTNTISDPLVSATTLRDSSGLIVYNDNNAANDWTALILTGGGHTSDGNAAGILAKHINVGEDTESTELHLITTNNEAVVDAVTINSAGNVGIGTTDPDAYMNGVENLVVVDAANSGISIISGTSNISFLNFGDGTGGLVGSSSNRGKIWYNMTDEKMHISTGGSLLTNPDITIKSGGNVGIGTTNPSYALDVRSGDVNIVSPNNYKKDGNIVSSLTPWVGAGSEIYYTGGAVGIGTTNPSALFDVYDAGTVNAVLRYGSAPGVSTNIANLIFQGASVQLAYISCDTDGAVNAGGLHFATNAGGGMVRHMMIDKSGNVGIGTTNPATDLSIRKTVIGGDVHLRIRNDDNTNANSNAILSIASGGESAGDPYILFDAGTSNTWTIGEDGSDTDKFKISYALGAKPGTGDRFVIDTAGNVGIGTTNPSTKLDVEGAGAQYIRVFSTDNSAALIIASRTDESQDSSIFFNSGITSRGQILYDHNVTASSQKMQFKIGDNAVTAMTINGTGHVGIGMIAPLDVLDIGDAGESTLHTFALDNTASAPQFCIGEKVSADIKRAFAIRAVNGTWEFGTNNSSAGTARLGGLTYTNRFSITSAGVIAMPTIASGAGTNALKWNSTGGIVTYDTSSLRFKEDVADIELDTSKIFDLRPVSFTWKKEQTRDFGLIAEEVDEHIPELVGRDTDGEPLAVNYDRLSVLLLDQVKKQKNTIETLIEAVQQLSARVTDLEAV